MSNLNDEGLTLQEATIALLIPVYNAERFVGRLKHQIDSLSPPFDEILIYDDGSSDRTVELLRDCAFNVIEGSDNHGQGFSRNILAKCASSTWIHFHDVDDEIVPSYVKTVRRELCPSIDVLFHNVCFLDEKTRKFITSFEASDEITISPARRLLLCPMPTSSSVIRRELFLRVGGFDEWLRCFEDGDLHLRMALASTRVGYLRETLEVALRHDGGVTRDMARCHRCRAMFLERYLNELPPSLLSDVRDEFFVTATNLFVYRDYNASRAAFGRYLQLGGTFPITSSIVLRFLSRTLPAYAVFVAQLLFRRFARTLRHSAGMFCRN